MTSAEPGRLVGPRNPSRAAEPSPEPVGPVRTCVGCRGRESRSVLVRVVVVDGRVTVDETASLPGRGAWLHPQDACLDQAVRRRAFARALRVREADASDLRVR